MENKKMLTDKIITIPLDEFYMLTALKGLQKVYGFQRDINLLPEEDMLLILNSMVKKGILLNEKDQFVCVGIYKTILSYIEYANNVICVSSLDNSKTKCICYLGNKMLVTSISAVNTSRLQIKIIAYEHFAQFLKDFGCYENLWLYDKETKEADILRISNIILPHEEVKNSITIRHRQDGLHLIFEQGNQKTEMEYMNGIAQEALAWLWRNEA